MAEVKAYITGFRDGHCVIQPTDPAVALVDADDTSQERVDEIVKDEHEPVAWANSFDLQNFDMKVRTGPDLHHTVPLYTAPPKKQWVSLTDHEVWEAIDDVLEGGGWLDVARVLEQAFKEKNT